MWNLLGQSVVVTMDGGSERGHSPSLRGPVAKFDSHARRLLLVGCFALAGTTTPALADQLGETGSGTVIKAPADLPDGKGTTQGAAPRPVGRTVLQSSRMEAAPAELVSVGKETWTVSHARNPSGSFLLVRNVSPPDSGRVLTVSLGAAPEQVLAARETSTWSCDALEGGSTLLVRATTGETVFAGEVACGDAVYLRSSSAP